MKALVPHAFTADWLEARISPLPDAPGCWIWMGPRRRDGYGQVAYRAMSRNPIGAHRFVYAHFVGPIPPGVHILHRCCTTACVRPSHLYAGTRHDNMRDRSDQGRYQRLAPEARRAVVAALRAGRPHREVALLYGISVRHAHRIADSEVSWADGPPPRYSRGEAHAEIVRQAWARRRARA